MSPKILLVDDDQAVLLSHSIILERQGYTVVSTATFKRAIELVSEETFDLLICDLTLDQGANGLDVVKVAFERNQAMPIILLTGYHDTEVPADYPAETVTLVSKPAMIPDLLQIVRTLLERGDSKIRRSAAD